MAAPYLSGQTLRGRWDAIRAGWPTLLTPFFGSLLVVNTGQGKEALFAMTPYPHNFVALVALTLCGLILYARFISAVNDHYPFSVNAIHSSSPVPFAALFAACAMPLVFSVVYAWQEIAQIASHGANPYWSGLAVCVSAIAVLLITHNFAANKFMHVIQTHSSKFLVFNRIWRFAELALVILLFVAAFGVWLSPRLASDAGPVPVFAIAMTVWAVFGNLVVSIVAKKDWMPSPVLVLILFIALIAYLSPRLGNGHYFVEVIPRQPCENCQMDPPPLPVAVLTKNWLTERARGGTAVPAIVVTADGGGIRAALETATILAKLDEISKGKFFDEVYALSGVSGGAIGIAAFLAARAKHIREPDAQEVRSVEFALSSDHFSPLLSGLLLRDLPDMLVPISLIQSRYVPDRARLFEHSLSEDWPGADEMRKGMVLAVQDTASPGRTPPIVLLNATLANAGTVETVSNVRFPETEGAETLCNVLDRIGPKNTLSLATAAHLSARFPIVDSPGEIIVPQDAEASDACKQDPGTRLEYVDGGYADNTGAIAALHAVDALESAREDPQFRNLDLRVFVIHIYASAEDPQNRRMIRAAGDHVRALDDLQVPMQAVGAVRYELGLAPLKALCERVGEIDNQSPKDKLGSYGACEQLGANQARMSEADHAVVTRVSNGYACVLWINASLYLSDMNSDSAYVPLGWMLGPKAPYVADKSEQIAAQDIAAFFSNGSSFDPLAAADRTGCSRISEEALKPHMSDRPK